MNAYPEVPDQPRGVHVTQIEQPPLLGRRRMLVLREAEFDKATYEAPELFSDAETWVVNYDDVLATDEAPPALARLTRLRLLRPDQVFLLSPYDDAYVPAHDAEEAFSLRKFEIFTTLCYLLGAKEVVASRVDVDESSHHRSAAAGGSRGPASAEAELGRDLRSKVAQRVRMTSQFDPGEPQVEAAAELLETHGLMDDNTMRGLLDLFQRGGGGRVRSKELVLNVTSEASRELKAVASLKIPAVLSISLAFSEIEKHVQDLLVELRVTF